MTGKTVSSIIEPHKELLVDMIPPKKHLLKHQPINTQIALMVWIHDGAWLSLFFPSFFFLSLLLFLSSLLCLFLPLFLSLFLCLFSLSLSGWLYFLLQLKSTVIFHQFISSRAQGVLSRGKTLYCAFLISFYSFLPLQLITLCGEGDDAVLAKSPCYKGVQSLVPLKINGLGNDCTELHHIMTAKYYLFFLSLSPLSTSLPLSFSLLSCSCCLHLSEWNEREDIWCSVQSY